MNYERISNMWASLDKIDEILVNEGFHKENVNSSSPYFVNDNIKLRCQSLNDNINFYYFTGTQVLYQITYKELLDVMNRLDEKKFITFIKNAKEDMLLKQINEDFR